MTYNPDLLMAVTIYSRTYINESMPQGIDDCRALYDAHGELHSISLALSLSSVCTYVCMYCLTSVVTTAIAVATDLPGV